MTSQLIDLVNTTNNIVFENLQKLNSKFKKIQKNIITNEESQYDYLTSKISIYFTTFIEQMKSKFILSIRKYEKQINQNNKDIIELLMENMLLKLEKDDLKQKEIKYLNDYTKNSINTNIIKNLNNIKKNNNMNNPNNIIINSRKKNSQKNSLLNNGICYDQNKNNIFPINNFNLFDIFNTNNKASSKKKKKSNSCNKFNNNNYNFNFITGSRLDLNKYYSRNKTNISYNTIGKNIFGSQENLNVQKNKNSFSLKDFRKANKGINKTKSKKSSSKKNTKHFNYISDDNFLIDNYKSKKGYDNNNMQIITEPCYKGNIKNKEKNNFYCIKQIKEEMNEILKNKKNINDNNYICDIHNTETGNIIENQMNNNNNKIKLPMGYNYYYSKNKLNNNNNINISTTNKKKSKNNIQNKFPKEIKPNLHINISQTLNTDKYKDSQYKINYTINNVNSNNYQLNNNPKIKQKQKLSKYPTHMYNNHSNSNILENLSINTNKKTNLINNNNCDSSILKNLKKISLFNNISNSKSCVKLNTSKKSNINNSNNNNISSNKKKYINLNNNNESYNDNINNNISYNLRNKGMSRNYSNFGTNINNNNFFLNNNYRTINNFNKVNPGNNQEQIIDINKSNIEHNRIYSNISDNSLNLKIKNKISMKNQNNLNININNINDMGKNNNICDNNISVNYLINNNKEKMDIKKIMFSSEENNKSETPSFYLFKK